MPKFSFKINVIALMMLLSLGCLIPAHSTFAFFSDSTSSSTNSFKVGILSNMVQGESWVKDGTEIDSVPLIRSGDVISRKIIRANSGTMDFQYKIGVDSLENDSCSFLQLQAVRNGEEKYQGALLDLNLDESIILGVSEPEEWIFTVMFTESAGSGGQCSFAIVFQSWQPGLNWGEGFSHTSRIENILEIESVLDTEEQIDDLLEEQTEFNPEQADVVLEEDESDGDSELLETVGGESLSLENDEDSSDDNQNNSPKESISSDLEEESGLPEGNPEEDETENNNEEQNSEEIIESSDLEEESDLPEVDSDEGEMENNNEEQNSEESVESSDLEEESDLPEDNPGEGVEDDPSEDISLEQEGEFSNDEDDNPDEVIDDSGDNSSPDLDSGNLSEPSTPEEDYVDLPEEVQAISEPETTGEIDSGNQESDLNNQDEGV